MIIGIPRALIYWKKPYFWEIFFEELGCKVLLSPKTNKIIVENGAKISDPETCFSNKVYWGHVIWLDGKCDMIFIPRLKSKRMFFSKPSESSDDMGEVFEYCPKFFGIPDVAKILVKTKILTKTFDEKNERFIDSLWYLGKKLGKKEKHIKKAARAAFLKEKEVKEREKQEFFEKIKSKKPKIVLVSHPYNLYDEYVNLRIKEKLLRLGVEPIFIENIPLDIKKCSEDLLVSGFDFHWEFGKEIMEKVQRILKYDIAGAIEISSFACGCDAVLKEFVEKAFKKRKVPFLYLIIDEHTGEAGFQTRLEAFIDTL